MLNVLLREEYFKETKQLWVLSVLFILLFHFLLFSFTWKISTMVFFSLVFSKITFSVSA